ncbi:MAG: hypothetical protein AB7R89_31425 [Dehalococcoidia bacterium]
MAGPVADGDDVRYTVAHGLVLVLLLTVAILVPWALVSVIQDIRAEENPLYFVTDRAAAPSAPYRLYLDLTRLNDGEGTITLQATAQRRCLPTCAGTDQLTLLTIVSPIGDPEEWLPVSVDLSFAPGHDAVSQAVQLPAYGDPLRYPFDQWSFGVLVIPQRGTDGGTVAPVPAAADGDSVAVSLQSRIPRLVMAPDPQRAASVAIAATLLGVPPDQVPPSLALFILERPHYLQVLTVLLVLLVTAAAAYAVFLRPLDQLVINAGALILGIWGVRAILLGTDLSVLTLVDLALMSVILFLLVMITARVLWLVQPKSGLHRLRLSWRRSAPAGAAAPDDGPRAGHEGGASH